MSRNISGEKLSRFVANAHYWYMDSRSKILFKPWLFPFAVILLHFSSAKADSPSKNHVSDSDRRPTEFEVSIGPGLTSRRFDFRPPNGQSEFPKLASYFNTTPFLQLRGQIHPIKQLRGLGISGQFNLHPQSEAFVDTPELESVIVRDRSWQLNLRYRHQFLAWELAAEAGLAKQTSRFSGVESELLDELPSVDYLAQRLAIQATLTLTSSIRFTLGTQILGPYEVGPLTDRLSQAETANGAPLFRQINVFGSWGATFRLNYQINSDLAVSTYYLGTHFEHEYTLETGSRSDATDDFRQFGLHIIYMQ